MVTGVDASMPCGLILSSAETEYSEGLNDAFVMGINKQLGKAGKLEWHNYHQVGMQFATGSIRAFLLPDELDLKSFKFVYFKSYFRYHEQATAIAEYLASAKVPFLSSEFRQYMSHTKLTQLARLARAGIPIPTTLYMFPDSYKRSYKYLTKTLGSPIIFKAIDGSGGRTNYLVHTIQQLGEILQKHPGTQFIAQKFIPNQSDYRLLVVNKRVELVIKRQRRDHSTHLNNTSQGADVSLLPKSSGLSVEVKKLALKAAALMRRETAGVDVIFDSTLGKPYILEINASPQIASGAFTEEKLQVYSNFFINMLK